MAINNSCTIMLVGHGAISNDKIGAPLEITTNIGSTDIGGYHLMYPVPPGDSLERFGHNYLLHSLGSALKPTDILKYIIDIKSVSHCDSSTAEIARVNDPDNPIIAEYIKRIKIRCSAEHSISNANNVLGATESLLPSELADYTYIRVTNFSVLIEKDLDANLAIRRKDQIPDPTLTYVTGLGQLIVFYNKAKVARLLTAHKNSILAESMLNSEAIAALKLEIEDLANQYTQKTLQLSVDQKDGLDALYNKILSTDNDKDIQQIWGIIGSYNLFPSNSFPNLNQKATRYIEVYAKYESVINYQIEFDENNLLYISPTTTTDNIRGLTMFWSSVIKTINSLSFAFTNNLSDPSDSTFTPLISWFTTPNDPTLIALKQNYHGNLIIVKIPSNANIVLGACRVPSAAIMTEDPQTHLQVEIFPKF